MSIEWERHVHWVETWGTVITLDIRGEHLEEGLLRKALGAAEAELLRIDDVYSTFKPDSLISQYRDGRLTQADLPPDVQEVIAACAAIARDSHGFFDPWSARGGFDPSGYVKGWGAQRAARILADHGFTNVSVNAAGDVACLGESAPGQAWRMGIADPRDPQQIVHVVPVTNQVIATSGRYEQGDHIVTPAGRAADGEATSATIIAADGGTADAYATALLLAGPRGLTWFAHMDNVSAYLVSGGQVWTTGPAFETAT